MAHEGSRQERQARDRGVTRSKAEKARPPTVPVPQVDIVPGRLNEAEWMALAAIEEGEDVVGDILADLLARVMDSAFRVYLSQQCIPFTISQAREAMLQIIEWRFLARDEGESAVVNEPTWGEDEEPLACTTDAWAQGSVPVLHAPTAVGPEDIPLEEEGTSVDLSSVRSWIGKGSQELMTSWELPQSPEPGVSLEPQPSRELSPEAGPGTPVEDQEKGGSLPAPEQMSPSRSPQPVQEQFAEAISWVSPEETEMETGLSSSSLFSLEDLRYCLAQPDDGAGERAKPQKEGAQLASDEWGSSFSEEPPAQLSGKASVPQPPKPGHEEGSSLSYAGHRPERAACLDPGRLPRPWVRPLVQVLPPDSQLRPLETYRGRPRKRRPQGAQRNRSFPAWRPVPLAAFGPLQRDMSFQDLDPGLGLHSPTSDSPLPPSGSKLHFLASGFPFRATHPTLSTVAQSSSPKLWPSAQWPRGCEGEAELLGELWAGRTHVLPRGSDAADPKQQDSDRWPHPKMLKATSQVMWKPVMQPEALTLSPGVSLWDPSTQTLLRSGEPRQYSEEPFLPTTQQRPIQPCPPQPEVTVAELANTAPRVWSLSSKHLPHPWP
ncbi:uncharacterized protein C2orf81 homolog [Echinops telfairi]|uniref:Uncharacterized protein C2orf81 homolog n=1 Tax=Echinops telfairi TaxID=9371 RepID=A0ABM0IBR3_ECHTE|nr:uncharacterized protein C2orf81 homolog [Echinops telfairi]